MRNYFSLYSFNLDTACVARTACRLRCSHSRQQPGEETYEDDIKNKILAAALPFVTELGWSKDAISAGAKTVGYPGVTHGLFPNGGAELIHYFQKTSNLQLVEILKRVSVKKIVWCILKFCFLVSRRAREESGGAW